MSEPIKILVTKTLLRNLKEPIPLVVGVISAGVLTRLFTIDQRDTKRKQGYQRELANHRLNRLVHALKDQNVDLPTAVLLNLRNLKPRHLREEDGQYYFFPDNEFLHVVDGQHRVQALARLVEEDPERWSSFNIPFSCMLGADKEQELGQFYIVNSTAKSVRTDLALDLLKQLADKDPSLREELVRQGEVWKVDGQLLAEKIASTSLWKNKIRFPGSKPPSATVTSSSLVTSLRALLQSTFFPSLASTDKVKVLDAYWQGIKSVIPEAFEEPDTYVLQKSIGVLVMHAFLVYVLEIVRSQNKSLLEPASYAVILKEPLNQLKGETGTAETVQGADFWKAGKHGAAGSFSSNSGKRTLLARLRIKLPIPKLR